MFTKKNNNKLKLKYEIDKNGLFDKKNIFCIKINLKKHIFLQNFIYFLKKNKIRDYYIYYVQ